MGRIDGGLKASYIVLYIASGKNVNNLKSHNTWKGRGGFYIKAISIHYFLFYLFLNRSKKRESTAMCGHSLRKRKRNKHNLSINKT